MRDVMGISLRLMMALALAGCANDGNLGSGSGSTNNPPGGEEEEGGGEEEGPVEPYCEILWLSPGSSATTMNLYVVEMPIAEWVSGTKTFGDTVGGYFLHDADEEGNAPDTAEAVSGSFELTVAGTNVGDAVQFSDVDAQTYDGETQAAVASDGRGTFTGVLSDPETETPPAATGSIAITYAGTAYTLGDAGALALCETAVSE